MPRDHKYKGVQFTMGPISIYQFAEFSKCGMGAIKLFQYIKTKEGLTKEKWCVVDNVNAYKWFGLSTSSKWRAIKKLKEKKLIKVDGSKGRAPRIKIVCPKTKLN
tara:strand:+ start:317 stop:631 length:315 start_codon:yes stop_codon:yes gene_type:complete